MRLASHLLVALDTLKQHRIRSGLTILGIVIGIASTVIMVSLGLGVQQEINRQFEQAGVTRLTVRGKQPADRPHTSHEQYALRWEDYLALAENRSAVPGLAEVVPIAETRSHIQSKERNSAAAILGVTPVFPEVHNLRVAAGSFFTPEDNQGRRLVAVLGATLARELFVQGAHPIGASVRLFSKRIEIIGVLAPTGSPMDSQLLLPFMTLQKRLLDMTDTGGRPLVDEIHIHIADVEEIETARQAIAGLLRWQRGIGALEHDDFEIESAAASRQALAEISNSLLFTLATIAAISLVVGGIGVTNIMLVSLGERTREIGIRYAVGATGRDMVLMLLLESIVLCLLGGMVGLSVCAYGILLLRAADIPAVLGLNVVLLALAVSMAVGLLAGIYPAVRTRRLTPVEALRHL